MNLLEQARLKYDQLINVPSSDPDDARRRKLLNIILFGMLAVAVILLILTGVLLLVSILKPSEAAAPIQALLATVVGAIIFYLINRLWSGTLASILFLLFLFFVISLADSPGELANGRSVFLFAIPIIAASVLVGPTSAFVFYALSAVLITILALFAGKPATAGVFPIFSFFFLTIVVWLSARNLEQALKDLRAINADLDRRVADRTRELSESLGREAAQANQREAILNSIADGVAVFDNNGTAIVVNPSLSALTGLPREKILGQTLPDLLKTSNLSSEEQMRMVQAFNGEDAIPIFRVNWGDKTLSVNAAEVQSGGHEPIGLVAVLRDVTREAELEKMKDAFLAIVSHELRTPLNAILGFAEMIKETVYGPVSDSQVRASVRIMENTKRLLSIVSELLDQAQIQSGRLKISMEPCEPAELLKSLRDTMEKIADEKGVRIFTALDPAMPKRIMGDAQRLQQILINLTNNAIKFSEKGDEVRVTVTRQEGEKWQIQVTDTGAGIPQDALGFIFDTFRQVESSAARKHSGVGLGLAIVKQLVELMNGTVVVESQLHHGSTFTVTLPLISTQEK